MKTWYVIADVPDRRCFLVESLEEEVESKLEGDVVLAIYR